jgi:hypothetical protein
MHLTKAGESVRLKFPFSRALNSKRPETPNWCCHKQTGTSLADNNRQSYCLEKMEGLCCDYTMKGRAGILARSIKETFFFLFSIFVVVVSGDSSNGEPTVRKVHTVTETLPEFPKIDVSTRHRFLNDLMLSPLWKVEKQRDGSFIAKARSIVPGSAFDPTGRQFLFEFMMSPKKALPAEYVICDRYLRGDDKTFTSFQIQVVFSKPDSAGVGFGKSGEKMALEVERYGDSPDSLSDLAVKLSAQHEIYVVLHEQGADPTRRTTFDKLQPALRELADIAGSSEKYRVEERYAAFFKLFFRQPLKEQEMKRFPGIQGRDTFYGYFRAKPSTSYNGINIKISHPVYCPDEGTRDYSRLEKAEYCGVPYHAKDLVFFLIEDNAVYLPRKYDERFGYFSGKETFDGTVEVLNETGTVLLKTVDKFTGWER